MMTDDSRREESGAVKQYTLTNLTPVEWNEHNALAIHKSKRKKLKCTN